MDLVNKKRSTKYDRVMSRLYNRSRSTVNSTSNVTRHRTPSTAGVGAKASSSNLSSGVFSELPVVLNDYVPETPVKKSFVVKPRRTIKSLDPAKSPQQVLRPQKPVMQSPYVRVRGSAPSVLYRSANKWSDEHYRECLSSRSHSRVKELKNEILEYQAQDKLMKLRSRLYKSCGVVLDDVGHLAQDKAVQADPPPETDKDSEKLRRNDWITMIGRPDLLRCPNLRNKSYAVCSIHLDESMVSVHTIRKLLPGATPTKCLPGQQLQKNQHTVLKPASQSCESVSTQTENLDSHNCQTRKETKDHNFHISNFESVRELNEDREDFDLNIVKKEINDEQNLDANILKEEIDYDGDFEQNCDSILKTKVEDPISNYKNSSFTDDAHVAQGVEKENPLLRKLLLNPRKMTLNKPQVLERRRKLLEQELNKVKKTIESKSKNPSPYVIGE